MIVLVGLEKARDAPSVFTRSGVMMSEGVITTMLYQNRLLSVSVEGPLEDEKKDPHKDQYQLVIVFITESAQAFSTLLLARVTIAVLFIKFQS
ncbi:MAG: hypothetical protein WA364_08630 [Candidatus Nitrosopolaris sp.]